MIRISGYRHAVQNVFLSRKKIENLMKSKSPTSWHLLTQSYLYTAHLLADEVNALLTTGLFKDKNPSILIHLTPLTFSAIFNTRHGIELFLKSLIVIQKNGEYPKTKKFHTHNLCESLKILEDDDDGLTPINSIHKMLDGINVEEDLALLKRLVNKYQEYDFKNYPTFLKKEIFANIDNQNSFFRFPDTEPINEAIRFLFDEHFDCHGDINMYINKNSVNLCQIIGLANEIKADIGDMIRLNSSVGNNVAAYVSSKK